MIPLNNGVKLNTLTAVLLIACVTSCAALFLDSCDSVASHGWRPCEKCQVCECLPLGWKLGSLSTHCISAVEPLRPAQRHPSTRNFTLWLSKAGGDEVLEFTYLRSWGLKSKYVNSSTSAVNVLIIHKRSYAVSKVFFSICGGCICEIDLRKPMLTMFLISACKTPTFLPLLS